MMLWPFTQSRDWTTLFLIRISSTAVFTFSREVIRTRTWSVMSFGTFLICNAWSQSEESDGTNHVTSLLLLIVLVFLKLAVCVLRTAMADQALRSVQEGLPCWNNSKDLNWSYITGLVFRTQFSRIQWSAQLNTRPLVSLHVCWLVYID